MKVRIRGGGILAACPHRTWLEEASGLRPEVHDLWLNGAGRGLCEYARGNAVLHGSAVSLRGHGVSIVGASRTGKSSLVALLCQRGWEFVSDAMTVVEPDSLSLVQQPSRIRLHDDSVCALGGVPSSLPLDDAVTGKRSWLVATNQISTRKISLEHVFALQVDEKVSVQDLSGAEAVLVLVANAYLSACFDAVHSGRLLNLCSQLINSGVHVRRLTYPKQWDCLPEVIRLLETYVG